MEADFFVSASLRRESFCAFDIPENTRINNNKYKNIFGSAERIDFFIFVKVWLNINLAQKKLSIVKCVLRRKSPAIDLLPVDAGAKAELQAQPRTAETSKRQKRLITKRARLAKEK